MSKRAQTVDLALGEFVGVLPLPAVVVSGDDEPLSWNEAFARLMGHSPGGRAMGRLAGFKHLARAVADLEPSEEPRQIEVPRRRRRLNLWAWVKELDPGAPGEARILVFADSTHVTSEYDQLLIYAEELGGLYHTVRKQYRQLARLHQASEMLQRTIRLDEVAATALQQMSGLYRCRAAIVLLLPELEELRAFVINEPDGPIERIVGGITPAYTSRLKRALGKDRKAKDLSKVWPPAVGSQVTAAQLDGLRAAATFHLGRNRLGFLCLSDGDALIDAEYVRAFADQVSLAVQNALLYDDLQRKAMETEILLESARHLGESLSINNILQSLSELTARYILSREGAVAIALPSPSREVVLAGTIRHKDGTMTPLSLSLLKNGGPDGASNPTKTARDLERVQELLDDRLFGVQGSQIWREPVAAGDQQGELMVLAPEGEPLNPTEQRLMKAIASHAEVALSHAVLYSRERSHAAYLAQQQDKRVEYLQQMAHELKTPLTAIRPLLEVAASLPSGHDPMTRSAWPRSSRS